MKMTKKEIYFWFVIFALSTLAYSYIQDTLRPASKDYPNAIKYLLGVGPNYFAGLSLPAFFMFIAPHVISSEKLQNITITRLRNISIIIALTGLIIWETVQLKSKNGYFDSHDIIWTFIGALTFLIIQRLIQKKLKPAAAMTQKAKASK